ncbi:MAG: NAD(P)H-binding protein [Anaerolineales bacterium]|uniref:SDR family oxidoreductase n=1 Tax=Candidatus Villigracilis proximus TaxID=3140683 RepID=UPI003136F28D|nr:NAD(P)H-binding protein [Anaerolineales bacterium]
MDKKILVIGAAGFVGAPVTKQLLADGFSVRALVRNADKARQLLGDKVEIVTGSFEDKATLEKALADVSGVNISVPWQSEAQVARDVTEILARQGRKNVRVSYISGTTANPENRGYAMIDEKLKAEEVLKKSGVEYTILRPSWFMDALALFVNDGRATVFGKQTQSYYFLSLADFARAVSKRTRPKPLRTRLSFSTVPKSMLLMTDALQQYCDARHSGVKAASMPIWFGKMLAMMMKSPAMKDFVQMMAYFEKSPKVSQPNGAESILGTSSMTMSDWLKN